MTKITHYRTTLLPKFQSYFDSWVKQQDFSEHWWGKTPNIYGTVQCHKDHSDMGVVVSGCRFYMCLVEAKQQNIITFTETFNKDIRLIESFKDFITSLERIEKIKLITRQK
jgi:hypothetical protein